MIGNVERTAGVADAANRLGELPHDLGPLGIAEVQVVGRADRLAAGARDVARRLGHREHRAAIRIEVAEAAVASRPTRPAPRVVPLTRTTPADAPGRAMVLVPTVWSYCRYAQRLLAMTGDAISASNAACAGGARRRVVDSDSCCTRRCHAGSRIGRR